jgi:hypothetical protein
MPKYPNPQVAGSTSAANKILSGYIFETGIHKPEHSNILSWKYPQYYTVAMLERLGSYEATTQDQWTWNIQDRTRRGSSVASLANGTTATATFNTTYAFEAGRPGYLIVGDLIRLETGVLCQVVATRDASGFQQVDVVKVLGGNFTVSEIANTMVFGHVSNAFEEGSVAPIGRVYTPDEESNVLQIIRRTIEITGTEFTNKTWLSDKSWYFTVEDIEQLEFQKDRELAIFFGEKKTTGKRVTRGILSYALEYGIVNTYDAGVGLKEEDIQDHIADLLDEGCSDELFVFAGTEFIKQLQRAMKQYALYGAQSYDSKPAGLDFQTYKFMGKTINFAHYVMFQDEAVVPFQASPVTGKINFSHFSIWLDFGMIEKQGRKNFVLKHKELNGQSRKFIVKVSPGMMTPDNSTGVISDSTGYDGFKVFYLSEIGIEVRFPNRIGLLFADSLTESVSYQDQVIDLLTAIEANTGV